MANISIDPSEIALTSAELEKPLTIADWSTIANCLGVACTHAEKDTTLIQLLQLKQRALYRRDALSHGRVMP